MWGKHSCLPVPGTFQSPVSASNCQLWSAKLENFATGRLESPPTFWETRPGTKAEVTVPSLDDWEKDRGKNSQPSVQPKLLPVDFRSPLAAAAQSN
jgi:hypothetical protein